jgi:hypothetical protein
VFGDGLGDALLPQGVKAASSPAFDPTPPSVLSAGFFSGADMVLGGVGPSSGLGDDQIVGIEGSFVKDRGAALRTCATRRENRDNLESCWHTERSTCIGL